MRLEKDIIKDFELLGLSSTEKREHFVKLGNFRLGAEPSNTFIYIIKDSNSSISETENENAELERDSR